MHCTPSRLPAITKRQFLEQPLYKPSWLPKQLGLSCQGPLLDKLRQPPRQERPSGLDFGVKESAPGGMDGCLGLAQRRLWSHTSFFKPRLQTSPLPKLTLVPASSQMWSWAQRYGFLCIRPNNTVLAVWQTDCTTSSAVSIEPPSWAVLDS